ncbi:unnamed protein product [Ceratitis capitata]|uniref:(Mediterranean fruit fly) hypothetical protein n=1 Tax=Ceratitis capitata TaxID=7213 RepID=A0A811U0C9_CERCA|nr:unnamed protein product [Ceratitis capitata]
MLSDTSVLSFYPSQFVLITDILDMFGKLVYERLNIKASNTTGDGRFSDKAEMLHENARETCQNCISSVQAQMDLYLLSGQVALLNLCLGQADAALKRHFN